MKLWTILNTDLKDLKGLLSLEAADDAANLAADATDALTNLNEVLDTQEVQDIAPWVEKGASLLDVLDTPEAELVIGIVPFAKIATGLLKFYLSKTQREPSLAQCVFLVCLNAYSNSLAEFLEGVECNAVKNGGAIKPKEALQTFEFEDREAKQTLLCFQHSELAIHLAEIMAARLIRLGLTEEQATLLTQRAAWNTHRYVTEAWGELPDQMRRQLGETTLGEWRREENKYQSIDTYLQEYVSPNPTDPARKQRWQVFDEPFTIKNIYVPLQAQPLTRNGDEDQGKAPVGLEDWATRLLNGDGKQSQVLFIQAGPGRGKSVFCRMFADWVREELYPIWTPILIRLRDIPMLQNSLEETLRAAVPAGFAKGNDDWLADRNARFLFLLDGFDELLMEGRTSGGLELFMRQVGQFQRDCTNQEMGHRIIVTGRPLALQGVDRTLPINLERVAILPMGHQEQQRWFDRWEGLTGKDKTKQFCDFLQDEKCPERLKGSSQETGLAQEPLILYLLAAMHRDDELDLEIFEGADSSQAKVLIYQKALDWVLTKQRSDLLNRDVTEFETEGLHRILAEAGLCVIQSGGECASIEMIEARLKSDDQARQLLEAAQVRLQENPLRNALAAFYLQTGRQGSGSVEFVHKSFSEFLCAERIKQALEDWIYPGRRNQFEVSDEQLYWEIYDLLGTNVLTPEIVDYLMVLLQQNADFKRVDLFNRLNNFYLRWCDHEFLNRTPAENYPQKKWLQLQALEIQSGLHSVDVYAGLNVLIVLFRLHAQVQLATKGETSPPAEIVFYPCGEEDAGTRDDDRLSKVIFYADAIGIGTFTKIVGPHLSRANLSRANLSRANLSRANLSRANLSRANLSRANLSRANLDSANLDSANLDSAYLYSAYLYSAYLYSAYLDSANLDSANLSRANLDSANLSRANLDSANLSRANLYSANLDSANLDSANLKNITWNEETNWNYVSNLKIARNVPDALTQELDL